MVLSRQIEIGTNDLGKGGVVFAWHPSSAFLAVGGAKGKVMIVDRSGKPVHQFSLPFVSQMQWDDAGETLALITERTGTVTLYSHRTRKLDTLDTGVKELCFLAWSRTGIQLAIGTKKGALVIYNRSTQKKIPIIGTHSDAIIGGGWTAADNRIVLVSTDRVLSVSHADGSVASTAQLVGVPSSVELIEVLPTSRSHGTCTVAVNLSRTLQVVDVSTMETFTAQFQNEMGAITCLASSIDETLLIGFSTGIVGLAPLRDNQLTLSHHLQAFRDAVKGTAFGKGSGLWAAVGDNALRVFGTADHTLQEIKEDGVQLEFEYGAMGAAEWSPDGQNITVSTRNGNLFSYSSKVLNVSTACGSLVFVFVSTRVVGVKNVRNNKIMCTVPIDMDPSFMAAGMGILAVGSESRVTFYEYFIPGAMPPAMSPGSPKSRESSAAERQSKLIRTVDYPTTVTDVKVSSRFAAVVYGGRLQLHEIRESDAPPLVLPSTGEAGVVAVGISEPLVMYATSTKVCVMTLHNMQTVAEYTCRTGLKRAFPNPMCTKLAYVDDNNTLFILNPITEVASQAEGYEADHKSIHWDQADSTVFVTHSTKNLITFVCSPHSRHGATCESVLVRDSGSENLYTPLPADYRPVSLVRGMVVCQSTSGILDSIPLRSHYQMNLRVPNPDAFYTNFSLNRLRFSSQNISTPQEAEDLAVKALHMLDIELAIRVYRQLSQPSLVLCLEKIKHIHEKNLLIGHVSMIMGYFKDAQNFFLRSSEPLRALQMRRDLMQWEHALSLAKDLAPAEVPIISKEYAQQLEYRGEYAKALELFKNGQRQPPTGHAGTELTAAKEEVEQHNRTCLEGTARCNIRIGNVKEGVQLAMQSDSAKFIRECAELLEELHHFEEAAQLFERCGDTEQAAKLYIEQCNNLKAAARLLPQIKSRNIIGLYALGREKEGAYTEAEEAYRQAEDWDNVVRLKVDKLNDLHGAYVIVRKTKSADAAALVAKMCQKRGEFSSAVEFWVLAKCISEAFDVAKAKDCMFSFESALLSQVQLKEGVAPVQSRPDFAMVADYYEQLNKPGQAALYYHIAGNYPAALREYLKAGEPEDVEKAVEVVGKARNDALTNKLIDYLMGEVDGDPKDPSYIFKLYMALGSYEKAAKTSVIIATKEQETGNYKIAHKTLVEACRILQVKKMRIPNDLRRSLMLLHSYILVKDVIKIMHDDETACRLLLRVARNIQRFGKHISAIITSTVLQCLRSGFGQSAFHYACFLIQNEKYRVEINEKSRKKIEGVVRRRGNEGMEDPPEKVSPCPLCDAPVPEMELDCGACKNTLPFCIVTGKHVLKNDFTTSPCCGFPAIYSAFMTRLRSVSTCPLCDSTIDPNVMQKQTDVDMKVYL